MSKTDTSKVIISCDWNTTLNPIDSLIEEINLIDIYRQLHPSTKSFTYESKTLNMRSRIDFFISSRPLSNHVRKIETCNSIAPDHKSIYLNL